MKIEREGKKKRIDRVNFLKIEREGKKKELIDRRVDFLKILKNRDMLSIFVYAFMNICVETLKTSSSYSSFSSSKIHRVCIKSARG